MTFPRLAAMRKHWSEFPPIHASVAAYLGYAKPAPQKADDSAFDTFMSQGSMIDMSPKVNNV